MQSGKLGHPSGGADTEQAGAETAFLAHQDIGLLPGMGPGLLRTAAATGFREIGELARFNNGEALALFGKRGPLLRDTARGIDTILR
jgi:DNA polymerase-4